MLKQTIVFLFLLIFNIVSAQEAFKKHHTSDYGLKGNVLELEISEFEINPENDDKISRINYFHGGIKEPDFIKFDSDGFETERNFLYPETEYANDLYTIKIQYKNDSILVKIDNSETNTNMCTGFIIYKSEFPIEMSWYYFDNKTTYKSTFTYNNLGGLILSEVYLPSTSDYATIEFLKTETSYNTSQKPVEKMFYDLDNRLIKTERFHYHDDNNIKEIWTSEPLENSEKLTEKSRLRFSKNGRLVERYYLDEKFIEIPESKIIYTKSKDVKELYLFDKNGGITKFKSSYKKHGLVKSIMYLPDGKINYIYTITYDKIGNEIKTQMSFPANKGLNSYEEYQYEYDLHGNWTKRIKKVYGEDEDYSVFVTERIIRY